MNIGAVLIGMGAAILTAAYITEPLRHRAASVDAAADVMIEKWIAQAERGLEAVPEAQIETGAPASATTAAQRFCHHCGRPVKPDHNFCPGCGTRLSE